MPFKAAGALWDAITGPSPEEQAREEKRKRSAFMSTNENMAQMEKATGLQMPRFHTAGMAVEEGVAQVQAIMAAWQAAQAGQQGAQPAPQADGEQG